MEIIQEIQGGIKIFRLMGRLDHTTSQEFKDELFRAISGMSNKIIINCENLDYISSAGIRVILEAHHALLREDGQIILCSMQKHIREVFEKTKFENIVPIIDNMDQALEIFSLDKK